MARTAGTANLVLGAGAVALAVAITVVLLESLVVAPQLVPVLIVAGVLLPFLVIRPRWIVPSFLALTWTAIGGHFFGGLPSPIQTGAMVLLAVAAYFGIREPARAKDALLVMALLWLPLTASTLLHDQSAAQAWSAFKDLAFLPIGALCVRSLDDGDRAVEALVAIGAFLGAGAAFSVLVHPTALFPLEQAIDVYGNVVDSSRAAGPFGESNFFALSLAVIAPLAMYEIARGGWRARLGVVSLLALTAGIFAAGSRGALLSEVVGVLAYAFVSGQPRLRRAAVVMIVAGAALVPVFSAQTGSAQGRGVSGRATENLIAVAMFADHPVTGVGPENYPLLYNQYTRKIGSDSRQEREPHSLPLQIAAEQGIAGIVGWLTAAFFLWRFALWRGIWHVPVGRALTLALATYMVNSLFLHGSQLRLLYILIGLYLAVGWSITRAPTRPAT